MNNTKDSLTIHGGKLNLEDVVAVAREKKRVTLSKESILAIKKAEEILARWAKDGKVIYGMTTGLGDNIRMLIPPKYASELSRNILLSHAAGVGRPLPEEIVRAIMLTRLNCLAQGKSGISLKAVNLLLEMLNKGVHPEVPEQGSVGASGDLAPLAHVAICLLGEGRAEYKGEILQTKEAFKKAGIKSLLVPSYKEGLSLINGTSGMTAIGALLVVDSQLLLKLAQLITAISLEVLFASIKPFDPKGHLLKPHQGQINVAYNLRHILKGSKLIRKDKQITDILEKELGKDVVSSETHRQEAYSLRCIPQILGPVWDTLEFVKRTVLIETNAVDDNPLIISDSDVFHGGHFHGQAVAMAMDYLCIALIEIGILSERRTARILDRTLNRDLPPFLASGKPGLSYGYQGSQFTATSLVAENRSLSTPASIQSISTNAEFQDVVSMGMIAARKARQVFENTVNILILELMCAAQAAEYRGVNKLSKASRILYEEVREVIPKLQSDRIISYDFEKVKSKIFTYLCLTKIENKAEIKLK